MGLGQGGRADQLKSLACSPGDQDAPIIVRGLTGYGGHDSLIKDTGPEASGLIEAILGLDCPVSAALRVGPKSSSTQTKLSEHETNRGEAEKSERVPGEIFEILGQPAAAIKPRESAFDNPTSRQKLEPFCLRSV
jgi:hypothetical protein